MLGKFLDWVGGPFLIDYLRKLGAGKLAKKGIANVKEIGETAYLKYKRQVGLASIKPLLIVYVLGMAIQLVLFITVIALALQAKEVTTLTYTLVGLLLVPMALYAFGFISLPKVPEYKVDDAGEPVVYPEFLEEDNTIEHPFAGQRVLADDSKTDLSWAFIPTTLGAIVIASAISGVVLFVLCASARDTMFLYLSLVFFLGVAFGLLKKIAQIVNYFLKAFVKAGEGSIGYTFALALIALPIFSAKNVSIDSAKDLIAEEKFMPWYMRGHEQVITLYLLLALVQFAYPSLDTLGWSVRALVVFAVVGALMTMVGMRDFVEEGYKRTLNVIFFGVSPLMVGFDFFRRFLPNEASGLKSGFETLTAYAFHTSRWCEFIDTKMMFANVLRTLIVAGIIFLVFMGWRSVVSYFKKDRKESGRPYKHFRAEKWITIFALSLMGGLVIVGGFSAVGAIAGMNKRTTLCRPDVMVVQQVERRQETPRQAVTPENQASPSTTTEGVTEIELSSDEIEQAQKNAQALKEKAGDSSAPPAVPPPDPPTVVTKSPSPAPVTTATTVASSDAECNGCTSEFAEVVKRMKKEKW
jgi:hypothetical protein